MLTNERIRAMDPTEKEALLERVLKSVTEIDRLIQQGSPSSPVVREAKSMAEDLLRQFQDKLKAREQEAIAYKREITTLKQKIDEMGAIKLTVKKLEDEVAGLRQKNQQMVKERDEAVAEVNKIQELWRRFTSGE
jgi:predicted RNase H-like nuclease (RuvC/YqgF family)